MNNFRRFLIHLALGTAVSIVLYVGSHAVQIGIDPAYAGGVAIIATAAASFIRAKSEEVAPEEGE